MTQGVLRPPFDGVEFGIAEKIIADSIVIATGYTKEEVDKVYKKLGDMGSAAMQIKETTKLKRMVHKKYDVNQIYEMMYKISTASGVGSKDIKVGLLANILSNATPLESKYLVRYPLGELRLGAGDYTILEALALCYSEDRNNKKFFEESYNMCSDLGYVGEIAANKGIAGIRSFEITPFKPLRPALAERLPTAEEILEKMGGKCSLEQKYDGFRCQVHKKGNDVHIYSRNLEDTTKMFPDIKRAVLEEIDATSIIFEGEALAFNEATNEFLPFQETIQRKRKYGIEQKSEELPLHLFAFDVMYLNANSVIEQSYEKRREILEGLLNNSSHITPTKRIITKDPKEFERFFESSIENGLEGVMAKDLRSPYCAGARKFSWIKMKRSYKGILSDTLDLIIVGYFLGRGNRASFNFGGLLCAVYNNKKDIFETVSKIGTGFSEKNMQDFSTLLKTIQTNKKPIRVDSDIIPDFWTEPKYVIRVRADEITRSPTHTCGRIVINDEIQPGYALRFPRIIDNGVIRKDKSAQDATTTDEIISLYKQQKSTSGQ